MNVNINQTYDNLVIVIIIYLRFKDYYKLITKSVQGSLLPLNETLFDIVEGQPYQDANSTTFSNLSNDYETFKG